MLEGYKEMGASSVIGLDVQSALLGAISEIQAERVIPKQARHLKDWRRLCKSLEETAESGKTRQQELEGEMAALAGDWTQAHEQIASQEFVLAEKELDLANKENELASWAAEATWMQ